MNSRVNFRDIPKEESKRLAAEVFRQNPKLRIIQWVGVVVPIVVSAELTSSIVSKDGPFLLRLAISVSIAVALCAVIQEVFVRPRLKVEIERLKNAHPLS